MKIRFTFKTTDVVSEEIYDAVAGAVDALENLHADERQILRETRAEKLREKAREWFWTLEYVTVEWDTETNTCRVLPVGG